jgi:SAM-dependent methyltransferase
MDKNYWENRSKSGSISKRSAFAKWVKANPSLLRLAGFFLSSRVADEAYIHNVIMRYRPEVVLELACGGGKAVLPANSERVYGVDIEGFPVDDALAKGYYQVTSYNPPDYSFSIPEPVDLITCINLNAHVPFDSYAKIIRNALAYLKSEGTVLLINEHDNQGLSYSRFSDAEKKRALVNGMEHYYFGTKADFLARFRDAFPELELIEERSLAAIVTANQHYVYSKGADPTGLTNKAILAADLLLGPVNSVYTAIFPKADAFLVGLIFKNTAR